MTLGCVFIASSMLNPIICLVTQLCYLHCNKMDTEQDKNSQKPTAPLAVGRKKHVYSVEDCGDRTIRLVLIMATEDFRPLLGMLQLPQISMILVS